MKTLVIQKTMIAEGTELGVGAQVDIRKASSPIIKLIQRNYRKDNRSVVGDVGYLLSL